MVYVSKMSLARNLFLSFPSMFHSLEARKPEQDMSKAVKFKILDFGSCPGFRTKTVACIVPVQLLHHASGWQQLQSWSGRLPQPTNVQ